MLTFLFLQCFVLFLLHVLILQICKILWDITMIVFCSQHLFRIPDIAGFCCSSFLSEFPFFCLLLLIFLQLEFSLVFFCSIALRVTSSSRFWSENVFNSSSFLKDIYSCLLNSRLAVISFSYCKNVVPSLYCFHHFCWQIICMIIIPF